MGHFQIRIIEGSVNGGSDNRGSTVVASQYLETQIPVAKMTNDQATAAGYHISNVITSLPYY